MSAKSPVDPAISFTVTEEVTEEEVRPENSLKSRSETQVLEVRKSNDDVQINTKDFGLFPIPKHVRYDLNHPPKWTLVLNIAFGIASTFLAANLYYCQPLLIELADSFGVSNEEISRIPTLVQAGYAVGLLFISPLGDLVRRRPLLLLLTFLSGALTIGLPLTTSVVAFEVLSFLVGIVTVVPQILMPLAADLAPPERRASAISIVLSGLLLGILIARVVAGTIANFVTWRIVYYMAVGLQAVVLVMLWWMIPDYPKKNNNLSYLGILWTMAKFSVTEPVLVQAVIVNMLGMATFINFWVTLTFLLGGPIYNYSTLVIGLFGLLGMFGVLAAPIVGRSVDKLHPWTAAVISISGMLVFQIIQAGAGGINVAAVIIASFGIDAFRQMQQVSLTTAVLELDPAARARLNAVLLISLFIGQVMGTSAGTKVFIEFGWRPAAALSVAFSGFCLVTMLARGPHVSRYTWIGWKDRTPQDDAPDASGESGGGGRAHDEKVDVVEKQAGVNNVGVEGQGSARGAATLQIDDSGIDRRTPDKMV